MQVVNDLTLVAKLFKFDSRMDTEIKYVRHILKVRSKTPGDD